MLVISSEYATGTIRASLLAVPRRTPVLVAKALVFATVVFVVNELATFISFFVGAAILDSKVAVSVGDPGVLGALIGTGLYDAVLGVFSIAFDAIVRHTAGAITGIIPSCSSCRRCRSSCRASLDHSADAHRHCASQASRRMSWSPARPMRSMPAVDGSSV